MAPQTDFNLYKTIQAIHYITDRLGNTHFMKVIKLVFFADRFHIRKFGLPITLDDYKAMKLGPVGSATKDILKEYDGFFQNLAKEDKRYYEKFLTHEDDDVAIKSKCNYEELSKSEKNALDFSMENFGSFDQFELAKITHDYPEWKRFEREISKGIVKVADMNYSDFFKNPNIQQSKYIKKYLNGRDPFEEDEETLKLIQEYIEETRELCK